MLGLKSPVGILKIHPTSTHTHSHPPTYTCIHPTHQLTSACGIYEICAICNICDIYNMLKEKFKKMTEEEEERRKSRS